MINATLNITKENIKQSLVNMQISLTHGQNNRPSIQLTQKEEKNFCRFCFLWPIELNFYWWIELFVYYVQDGCRWPVKVLPSLLEMIEIVCRRAYQDLFKTYFVVLPRNQIICSSASVSVFSCTFSSSLEYVYQILIRLRWALCPNIHI